MAERIVVCALGDSITAGSPGFDPDPAERARHGFGDDPESQWEHWAALRDPRLEFRNHGIYGQRTDEIAARLEDSAAGADVLVVQGGINDIAQGRPVSAAAGDLRKMVVRGKELGLRVALVELLPWDNGYPAAAPLIGQLNASIDQIGRDEEVPVYAAYHAIEDPARPGRMRPELTIDGDHPSVAGYRVLGGLISLP
jgi:lysophospholipase L1-like esterase